MDITLNIKCNPQELILLATAVQAWEKPTDAGNAQECTVGDLDKAFAKALSGILAFDPARRA